MKNLHKKGSCSLIPTISKLLFYALKQEDFYIPWKKRFFIPSNVATDVLNSHINVCSFFQTY